MSDADRPHAGSQTEAAEGAGPPPAAIDPAQLEFVRQQLAREQNLPFGIAAGLVASLVGAGAWALVTTLTGYQIGFMAIAIGFLVGYAIRAAGKGITSVFGAVGAVLALAGCALGNLLAVTAIVADAEGVRFLDAVAQLNPEIAQQLMVAFFGPMDVLFYGIAGYEGWQLSFRRLGPEDLEQRLGRSGG